MSRYKFIALDVETANGNSHSICQVGLAMVSDNGVIETANYMVDPDQPFDDFNTQLHGIDAQAVAGAPQFAQVLDKVRDLLESHTLIQHSSFDKRAFNTACDLHGLAILDTVWLDSVIVARTAWPELKGNGGHGLASLKDFLGLEFLHHDAEEDARAAAEVVLHAEAQTGEDFRRLARTAKQKKADGD